MSVITPELSKRVGWEGPAIENYPSIQEVEDSPEIQLLRWHRFLRSPKDMREEEVINLIFDAVMR